MLLLHVTKIPSSSAFRAYVPPTCYRTLRLLSFSGTCSSNILPNSPAFLLFGHMFLQHVTELSSSSAFRAHVPPTCYRTLRLLSCSGTCSSNLLPNSLAPPLFGHMFLQYVTELYGFSPVRAHVLPTCYRTLWLLSFSGICSSNILPNSPAFLLFGHMFLQHVTELSSSSAFRAYVPPTCYRTLQLFSCSGTCSSNMLPNSPAPPLFGHMFLQHVTELSSSSAFRAHVPPTCYRTL